MGLQMVLVEGYAARLPVCGGATPSITQTHYLEGKRVEIFFLNTVSEGQNGAPTLMVYKHLGSN